MHICNVQFNAYYCHDLKLFMLFSQLNVLNLHVYINSYVVAFPCGMLMQYPKSETLFLFCLWSNVKGILMVLCHLSQSWHTQNKQSVRDRNITSLAFVCHYLHMRRYFECYNEIGNVILHMSAYLYMKGNWPSYLFI
jgi:hypothetical protein